MGGYGSSRWGSHWTRTTTHGLLRLDVRELARSGQLHPGTWSRSAWMRNGEPVGDINLEARTDALILSYRTKGPTDRDWRPVRERIWLDSTACHYGGSRPWFVCSRCGHRRAVLFSVGGRFRCRTCHDLAYGSTREDRLGQLNRRGEKVMTRLGAQREWVLNWLIPPAKPKGMHWRTYDRLRQEWRAIADAAHGVYHADLLRLIERTDRVLRERGG